LAGGSQGEEVGFENGDAVQAPGGVGQGLDEMSFGGSFWMVFVGGGCDVVLVGLEVLGGRGD